MSKLGSWPPRVDGRRVVVPLVAGLALLSLSGCLPGYTQVVAGDATAGTSGDTGPATSASLNAPGPIVAIPGGGFYVLDMIDCVLRKVDAQGIITTIAGEPNKCSNSDDSAPGGTVATETTIDPGTSESGAGVGLDATGNVYFDEAWRVRKVSPDGMITTVIDVTKATGTSTIVGFAVAPDGTVYIDHFLGFATGTHIEAVSPDGTTRVVASIAGPVGGLAAEGNGTLVIRAAAGDLGSPAIIETVDVATGSVTPVIDMPQIGFDSLGHTVDALLSTPPVASPDGTIYQVNRSNQVVRIDPDHTITVIAGNGTGDDGTVVQSGPALSLDLSPSGLALTPNDGLLISSGHVVYRLNDPEHAG